MYRLIVLLFCLVPWAHAQLPEALLAYNSGQYGVALRICELDKSAGSYALAARSVLAEGIMVAGVEPSLGALKQAEGLAMRALELDAGHIEGRMQLAIALSLRTRPMSTRAARRSGLGGQSKDLAMSVLADEPGNHYANGFMAVWHMEVLRRGGRVGGLILGASVDKGRAHYEVAARAAPDDGSLHWQWARALAATNPKKYRSEIIAALAACMGAKTDSALEGAFQARAKLLQDRLAATADDYAALEAYATSLI